MDGSWRYAVHLDNFCASQCLNSAFKRMGRWGQKDEAKSELDDVK